MLPTSPHPRHAQLRTWYEQISARIEAVDRDIGWALTQHDLTIHQERRNVLVADRELVTAYIDTLERGELPPGPWPPDFKTTDLLVALAPRILYKSGRHDFYRHISLPPNYIPRLELLAEVRERLLAGTGSLALTSAIQARQVDVLHGMGGIGKSVLARALCDDPEVQTAFPDGILWATLGQTPDLTARLREWIETLGGVVGQTAPTLDQFRNTLAETLRDKACLLIVDDAWRKAHLEPFCAGGPRCRLLITTRDAALAEGLDARVYPVPVMALDQAVALLEEWAQESLVEVQAEVKAQIVQRLGCLPLAVRLAGAQLRAKDPAEWLASFDARKLKTRRVETMHDSLEATFALSLDALDSASRRLYVALAIFKEDEPIPVTAIARLWSALDGRDTDETNDLLADLSDRALLARNQTDGDAVTFHDLLRQFMAAELGEEDRIAAHRDLLDAYCQTRQDDGWHTTPDDGYLYDHLAYHLDALADDDAAAEGKLHALFANQAWLHARFPQSGYIYDGYLADLERAWRRSNAACGFQIDSDQEPFAFATCVRYALIRTSINSLAANCVPGFVIRAVETGVWSTERALSVGRLIPDPILRTAMLTALVGAEGLNLDQRQLVGEEGLTAALSIGDGGTRAHALAALAGQLMGIAREVVLLEGLAATRAISDEWSRSWALETLAPMLTGELREVALQQGLAAAQAIGDETARAQALASIAPMLTGHPREVALQAGLAAVRVIDDREVRAQRLASLVPQLTSEDREAVLREELATADGIEGAGARAWALASLVSHLTGEVRESTLQDALASAAAIADGGTRVHILAELIPQLTDENREAILREALAISASIGDMMERVWALATLVPHLMGEKREVALQQALSAARAIRDKTDRANALLFLAPQLTREVKETALQEGLASAEEISDDAVRAQILTSLAAEMTGELRQLTLRESLSAVRKIRDRRGLAESLSSLAQQLTGELVQEGLSAVQAIHDEEYRARALATLLPQLTDKDQEVALREVLCAAAAIRDEVARAQAFALLARQLLEEDRDIALVKALATTQIISHDWLRAGVLALLAPQLTGKLLQQGLAIATAIGNEGARTRALVALSSQLIGEAQDRVLNEGLAVAQTINDEWTRAQILASLAPQLRGKMVQEGLSAAQAIHDKEYRAQVLMTILPQLTGEGREVVLREVLSAAEEIGDEAARAQILVVLAPYLTGTLMQESLFMVEAISDEWARAKALRTIAPKLTGQLVQDAMALAQAMSTDGYRAQALAGLLSHAPDSDYCLRSIRHAMADHLRSILGVREREDVLRFVANSKLFAPPILSPTTLAAIAGHIIEICQEREWL